MQPGLKTYHKECGKITGFWTRRWDKIEVLDQSWQNYLTENGGG